MLQKISIIISRKSVKRYISCITLIGILLNNAYVFSMHAPLQNSPQRKRHLRLMENRRTKSMPPAIMRLSQQYPQNRQINPLPPNTSIQDNKIRETVIHIKEIDDKKTIRMTSNASEKSLAKLLNVQESSLYNISKKKLFKKIKKDKKQQKYKDCLACLGLTTMGACSCSACSTACIGLTTAGVSGCTICNTTCITISTAACCILLLCIFLGLITFFLVTFLVPVCGTCDNINESCCNALPWSIGCINKDLYCSPPTPNTLFYKTLLGTILYFLKFKT